MQVYAMRMFNFIRYGETENSIVFDLTPEQRETFIDPKKYTDDFMDKIYDEVMQDPIRHIEMIKSGEKTFTDMACISGIIGGNLDESNGAGKSTMFEAMCYAIYDKIIRRNVNTDKKGSAGDSIAVRLNGQYPENLSECYVEMLFGVNDKIYVVKRGRTFSKSKATGLPSDNKPSLSFNWINAPTEDDKSQSSHRTGDTTDEIAKAVSMDYEVFVNSIMFGQSDAGKFLTGTDKVRKEMLVTALGAEDIVTGCLKDIRDNLKVRKDKVGELQITCNVINDTISKYAPVETSENNIKEYEHQILEIDKIIDKLDEEINKLKQTNELKEVERIKTDAAKVKSDLQELENKKEDQIKEWREHYNSAKNSAESKQLSVNKSISKILELETKIVAKENEISSFDMGECEKMLGLVEKAKQVKPNYEAQAEELSKENSTLVGIIATKESDLTRIEKDIRLLQSQIDLAGNKNEFICDKCKSHVTRDHINNELNKNKTEQSSLNSDIAGLKKKKQELEEKLKDAKEKVQKLIDRISRELEIKTKAKNHQESIVKLSDMKKDVEDLKLSRVDQENEIKTLEEKKKEYIAKGNEVKKQYEDKTVALEKRKQDLIKEYESAQGKASTIQSKIQSYDIEKKDKIQQKSSLNSKIGQEKQFIKTVSENKKKFEETQKLLEAEEKWYARYLLLEEISGLEGVQTKIVKKWLPLLNIHIKEVLNILTQGKMSLELFINNKSAIDMIITGGQADTFSMLSGGEKMIVRLAVDIGLGLLIFNRNTNKAEMIVLDEIFGPLDNSKTSAVFDLLQMLKDKFKRVLVISHKDEINKRIPHQILIEKDPGDFGYSRVKKVI